jgi:hypothetical protein
MVRNIASTYHPANIQPTHELDLWLKNKRRQQCKLNKQEFRPMLQKLIIEIPKLDEVKMPQLTK